MTTPYKLLLIFGGAASCLLIQGVWHAPNKNHSLASNPKSELWIWFIPHNQWMQLSGGLYTAVVK